MRPLAQYITAQLAADASLRRLTVGFQMGSRVYRIPALNRALTYPTAGDAAGWDARYPALDRRLMADAMLNTACVAWGPETGYRLTGHADELGPRVEAGGAALISRISRYRHPTNGPYGVSSPFLVFDESGLRAVLSGACGEVMMHSVDMAIEPADALGFAPVNLNWRNDPLRGPGPSTTSVILPNACLLPGVSTLAYMCFDSTNASREYVRHGSIVLYNGPSGPSVSWNRANAPTVFAADAYAADDSTWTTSPAGFLRLMPEAQADDLAALGVSAASMIKRWGVGTRNVALWDTGVRTLLATSLPEWARAVTLSDASSVPMDEWLLGGLEWLSRSTRPKTGRDMLLRVPSRVLGRMLYAVRHRADASSPPPPDPAMDQAISDLTRSTISLCTQHSSRVRYALPTSSHSTLRNASDSEVLVPPTAADPAITKRQYDRAWPGRPIAHLMGFSAEGPRPGGDGEIWFANGGLSVIGGGLTGIVSLNVANAAATAAAIGTAKLYTKESLTAVQSVLTSLGVPELGHQVLEVPEQDAEATFQILSPTLATSGADSFIEAVIGLKLRESHDLLRTIIGLRDAEVAFVRQVSRIETDLPTNTFFHPEEGPLPST